MRTVVSSCMFSTQKSALYFDQCEPRDAVSSATDDNDRSDGQCDDHSETYISVDEYDDDNDNDYDDDDYDGVDGVDDGGKRREEEGEKGEGREGWKGRRGDR